jgi:hypothetical protein
MTLLAYRFRPLRPMVLAPPPILLLALTWWLTPHLGDVGALVMLQLGGIVLGLTAAFTVSRDIDYPEPVLDAAPHPFWRTPALRVTLWLVIASGVLILAGRLAAARLEDPLPGGDGTALALANLIFVAGIAFLASARGRSFLGGVAALIVFFGCAILQKLWSDWPLRVLDTVGSHGWGSTRLWLLLTGGTLMAAGILDLRARGLPVYRWGSRALTFGRI